MKWKLFFVLQLISNVVSSQEISYLKNFHFYNDEINCESTKLILFGETHGGGEYNKIVKEYLKLLDSKGIDTLLLEIPYSTYIISKLDHRGISDRINKKIFKSGKVILPIEIEYDFRNFLEAVRMILGENQLLGTDEADKNFELLSSLNVKPLSKSDIIEYVDFLIESNLKIEFYQNAYDELLNRMKSTLSFFDMKNMSELTFRDSIMSELILSYSNKYKINSWGGIFGYYHIALNQDSLFLQDVDINTNMLNRLIELNLINIDNVYRISYLDFLSIKSVKDLFTQDSIDYIDSLLSKTRCKYVVLKKVNGIFIYTKR